MKLEAGGSRRMREEAAGGCRWRKLEEAGGHWRMCKREQLLHKVT
jgi:hypothetical protein